ncbi:MAG TPA: N-acetylneuraminate synthase family protein [bacterium]|nr:N-acetylneuraminate synthase family protein [bacterium]HOL93691.1 N-acetylneuraminate synthase family protein [bacterium]HPP01885.1 N-acetylneuraminate synthase family protein [bacterium]
MGGIQIGGRTVGGDAPCFIIAEGGLNHNGDPVLAARLIAAAAECGADAIKFQTYTTEELFPPDHPDFTRFQKHRFSRETYLDLQRTAADHGIILLSTPFDETSADLLESLPVPAFKIGSGELTHRAFLKYLASKGKPLILSTGMSTWDEVDHAVRAIEETGNSALVLLHCVSAYPCPLEEVNLRRLTALRARYPFPAGFSDHTESDVAAVAAVALGACVIEKHFTLSRHLPGWDHFFSYDPEQMKRYVKAIRDTEKALGASHKDITPSEKPIERIARRAIYARVPLKAGESINIHNIIIRRPAGPLGASQVDSILGRVLLHDLPAGTPLQLSDFEPE